MKNKILFSTNQFQRSDLSDVQSLKCDGLWLIGAGYPLMDLNDWQMLADNIITPASVSVYEEGGIGPDQLFENAYDGPTIRKEQDFFSAFPSILVNRSMVYYEGTSLDNAPTMTPEYIKKAYDIKKTGIFPLGRDYLGLRKTAVLKALMCPNYMVPGFCFEIIPNPPLLHTQQIDKGLDIVALTYKRRPWLLIPPYPAGGNYEDCILKTLTWLKKRVKCFAQLSFVFAVYNRPVTGVNFVGSTNSVAAAIKVAREF